MRRFDLKKKKTSSDLTTTQPILHNTNQNSSGRGFPSKKDLNNTSDLSGCEKGASCDAPLTVANDSMLP